jgi:hypothetical protein
LITVNRIYSIIDDEYSEDISPDLNPISLSVDHQNKNNLGLILSPNLNKPENLKMLALEK